MTWCTQQSGRHGSYIVDTNTIRIPGNGPLFWTRDCLSAALGWGSTTSPLNSRDQMGAEEMCPMGSTPPSCIVHLSDTEARPVRYCPRAHRLPECRDRRSHSGSGSGVARSRLASQQLLKREETSDARQQRAPTSSNEHQQAATRRALQWLSRSSPVGQTLQIAQAALDPIVYGMAAGDTSCGAMIPSTPLATTAGKQKAAIHLTGEGWTAASGSLCNPRDPLGFVIPKSGVIEGQSL